MGLSRSNLITNYFEFETTHDGELRCFSNHETEVRAIDFCRQLYGLDESDASMRVTDLDEAFSKAFEFRFEPLGKEETFV